MGKGLGRGKDIIGAGVGALIVDPLGRLFLARRGLEAKNERGCWEFPGGAVAWGETLKITIREGVFRPAWPVHRN